MKISRHRDIQISKQYTKISRSVDTNTPRYQYAKISTYRDDKYDKISIYPDVRISIYQDVDIPTTQ